MDIFSIDIAKLLNKPEKPAAPTLTQQVKAMFNGRIVDPRSVYVYSPEMGELPPPETLPQKSEKQARLL